MKLGEFHDETWLVVSGCDDGKVVVKVRHLGGYASDFTLSPKEAREFAVRLTQAAVVADPVFKDRMMGQPLW